MLSLANVKAIQAANYYAKDDYYSRASTEGDVWQGKLWKDFGASKELCPEDFKAALQSMPNPERAAIDLTFSAPKSVSIAMVLNAAVKADMLGAHNKAVSDTLAEIEKNEMQARVTYNGVTERYFTGNLAAAKFIHFVSRNQDMQLHTHCVILNRTEYGGKSYAISNENLYANHILYGQLYRNRLAKNLQEMGYSCHLSDAEKGFFELDGIGKETVEKFSTRRAEILEKLKTWNTDSAAAASRATQLTRKAKETKDLSLLEESWRMQIDEKITITKNAEQIQIVDESKKLAFEQAVARLSEKQFAFSRQALERAVLAEGCISGTERADFSSLLEKSSLIRLGAAKIDDGNFYFTTEENVKMEMEIKANLKNSFSLNPLSSPMSVLRHITTEKGFTLSAEQTEAVLHIARNSNQYLAVQGLAGTGKTYMLNAVRELYEQSGYAVRGASFTGKAAEGLQDGANIKSTTLHSFLNKLEKEAGNATDSSNEIKKSWDFTGLIPSKKAELWVIDEAGLTDNPLILHLQRAAKLKRAKVVFVGDYQQLSPVGMGNAYSNFVQSGEISTCYLSDIRRQKNQTLLEAVKASVSGDINRSLSLMAESTNEIKSTARRFKAISKEYTALPLEQQAKTIVLTAKNKDRVAINALIREDLIKSSALSTEQEREFKIQNNGQKEEISRTFAPNEKIIFLRNHHQLGIMNGQTGTIESIYGSSIKVKTNGKSVMMRLRKNLCK